MGVARADPASLPSTSRRDDRVLPATRVLAFGLVPILVTAFVILYGFPADTGRLRLDHPADADADGARVGLPRWRVVFVRVTRERRWARVGAGLLSVTLFATLLGVATVIHWDRFNHGHVAFWLWATLYLVAPFLVLAAWVANTQVAATPRPDELRLRPRARVVVAAGGGLALAQGLLMFAFPSLVDPGLAVAADTAHVSCRRCGLLPRQRRSRRAP